MVADFAAVAEAAAAAVAAAEAKAVESGHCSMADVAVDFVAHRLAVVEIAVIDSGVRRKEND